MSPWPWVTFGSAFMAKGRKKNGIDADARTASATGWLSGLVPSNGWQSQGIREHPAAGHVGNHDDQLVALFGRQRALRVVLLQIPPGVHPFGGQGLLDPVVEEVTLEHAFFEHQTVALSELLEVLEYYGLVLELTEVEGEHDLLDLGDAQARCDHRGDDGPG